MKIVFYYFSTHLGGQQQQILNLSRCFYKLGYEVKWIYEEKGDVLNEFNKYGEAICFKFNFILNNKFYFFKLINIILYNLRKYFFLKKYFKNNVPDLIISSDSLMSLIIGLSTRNSNIPQWRLIGADLESYEKIFKYYKILKIDRYVSLYFGWPLVYNSLLSKGVSKSKFTKFQYNAVDVNKFFPTSNAIKIKTKKSLGLNENDFIIGWVGRLDEFYGSRYLLSIGKKLIDSNFYNFKILFVGGGFLYNKKEDLSYVNYLKSRAIEYGLKDKVLFLGWLPYDEVINYYNIMDIVPMLEKDPSGGSILREAMACGRVAMSVDGPSHAQRAFMKSDNSILVQHKDFVDEAAKEIISLYDNKDRRNKLGKNARKYSVKSLSFEKQAKDILKYFK